MNVVSFGTAERLKEAGFTQPEDLKCRPQAWYTPDLFEGTDEYFLEYDADGLINRENSYYAPTATELLSPGWKLAKSGNGFICRPDHPFFSKEFKDANPAEAAAQAWLHVNATKTTKTI